MKKLPADRALDVGVLVLLVSLVGLALSVTAGQVVGPWAGGGMTLGIILMGWGAFHSFDVQEDPRMPLGEALERIRLARHL